jgi:hypothetical protein
MSPSRKIVIGFRLDRMPMECWKHRKVSENEVI